MKKKTVVGGRKVVPGPQQREALAGRGENQAHKAAFKARAFAKNDAGAGRPNGPLLPSSQNATPPKKGKS